MRLTSIMFAGIALLFLLTTFHLVRAIKGDRQKQPLPISLIAPGLIVLNRIIFLPTGMFYSPHY